MNILLTNDDGIEAPGLKALWQSVKEVFDGASDVLVVAPDRGRSECGHSVTSGRPLHVTQVRPGWFSVDGTPVDCVRVALTSLRPQTTLVLSGVNAGANLGVDLLVSGTFAAAREAALHGVSAMAISHYRRPEVPVTWDHTARWLSQTMIEFGQQAGSQNEPDQVLLWNVNLPAVDPNREFPPRVRCDIDSRPMRRVAKRKGSKLVFESDFHGRPRDHGTDVDRCFSGSITISELSPHFR